MNQIRNDVKNDNNPLVGAHSSKVSKVFPAARSNWPQEGTSLTSVIRKFWTCEMSMGHSGSSKNPTKSSKLLHVPRSSERSSTGVVGSKEACPYSAPPIGVYDEQRDFRFFAMPRREKMVGRGALKRCNLTLRRQGLLKIDTSACLHGTDRDFHWTSWRVR